MVRLMRACCFSRYSLKTGSIICAVVCAMISFAGFIVTWKVAVSADLNDDEQEAYGLRSLYITLSSVYAFMTLCCLLLIIGAKKENEMYVVYWVIMYVVLATIFALLYVALSVMLFTGKKSRFWKAIGTLLVGGGSVAFYGFTILVAFSYYRSLLQN
ncbi:uncharacterized protein [Anabrus simplex]|uniref:uncharacterized protein n=1 Tax=Anabrus simplex TaxID=316456 RepID=UPI0035A3517B